VRRRRRQRVAKAAAPKAGAGSNPCELPDETRDTAHLAHTDREIESSFVGEWDERAGVPAAQLAVDLASLERDSFMKRVCTYNKRNRLEDADFEEQDARYTVRIEEDSEPDEHTLDALAYIRVLMGREAQKQHQSAQAYFGKGRRRLSPRVQFDLTSTRQHWKSILKMGARLRIPLVAPVAVKMEPVQ